MAAATFTSDGCVNNNKFRFDLYIKRITKRKRPYTRTFFRVIHPQAAQAPAVR